jgi:hypothetical protein
MATDSEQSTAVPLPVPTPFGQAKKSCENPPQLPEQEWTLVIAMVPERTRSGVGRVVSRARAMPEPIVEFDVE